MARSILGGVAVVALLLGSARADEQCDQDSLLALSHRKRASITENKSGAACGNTGQTCASCQVCVGGMKSYACAGSCAVNDACGPGDSPGSCPTCADRVQTLVNNGMGVQDAMSSVGQNYGWTEPGCGCLSSPPETCYCGNTGIQCVVGEVCVGGMKSYACAGSCATNDACGPGDSPGNCPTCADRVQTLVNNGMGVQDAMSSVGQNYGWTEPGCSCMR